MYTVVRCDGSVLSRTSPDALLSWVDEGVTRATDFRYAIIFSTYRGALKCAGMQGGEVRRASGQSTPVGVSRGLGPWVDRGCDLGLAS